MMKDEIGRVATQPGSRPTGQAASRLDADALRSLARQCGRVAGPDRATDAEIALALGLAGDNTVISLGWVVGGRFNPYESPAFTASLDAAVSLVPEPMAWAVGSIDDNFENRPMAVVGYPPVHPQHEPDHWKGRGSTPALALCAAALLARASGIEAAAADETPQAAQPEGQEPGPKGDAQTTPVHP